VTIRHRSLVVPGAANLRCCKDCCRLGTSSRRACAPSRVTRQPLTGAAPARPSAATRGPRSPTWSLASSPLVKLRLVTGHRHRRRGFGPSLALNLPLYSANNTLLLQKNECE